jgi:site-specific DNA-methyltransferase (adenine-specific)
MTPRWTSPLTGSQVFEADARLVAATLPPGCASLAILDGPYGLAKAAWDKIPRGGTLADLYQGHLDDVGRICAASASLYLWNTSAGWAELHPHILARGWTFRSLIVWHKVGSKFDNGAPGGLWPEAMEVCGCYTRETYRQEVRRLRGTRSLSDMARLVGSDSRLPALWEAGADVHGECRPTLEQFERIGGADYYAHCVVMECDRSNIWQEPSVAGRERLVDGTGFLHPCQKPLVFAERMIRASSRPGDLVWAPFGGTLREMVAAERMVRLDPAEARKVVTCELNLDGKDYIGAALEQIGAEVRPMVGQIGLFGGGR